MEPDLEDLQAGLKTELDDLVAEQQKQYDRYEAQMRGMNAAQKALFVKQQMDGAAYDTAIGDNLELIKAAPGAIWSAAKAFPGFYKGYLKFLWKVAQLPGKMAGLAAQAVATGDINPLKAEIDKIVTPVASTYEEAMEYKSMLTILCSEPEVYELLYDFSETIKRISPNPKLLDRSKNAAKKAKKIKKATAKSTKKMPGVDTPKKAKKLEKTSKKKYGDDKNDGPKKTPEDPDKPKKSEKKSTTQVKGLGKLSFQTGTNTWQLIIF